MNNVYKLQVIFCGIMFLTIIVQASTLIKFWWLIILYVPLDAYTLYKIGNMEYVSGESEGKR